MIKKIPDTHHQQLTPGIKSQPVEKGSNVLKIDQLVHDLKSPVNSLKGIIKLANTHIHDEQVREYLLMINKCVDKLDQKIGATLEMVKHGKNQIDQEQVDFRKLIDEIMISLGHIEGFDHVKFDIQISNQVPFYSSSVILESVIQNLIENAIKYRKKDKKECMVKLHVSDCDSGIYIEVADDGIGISEEQLPDIFNANFKSIMSGKESDGLGLFIVKKAVEKMHGTIEVYSTEGVGARFVIDLPNYSDATKYVVPV